jgi:GH43 family beta-xylosidase
MKKFLLLFGLFFSLIFTGLAQETFTNPLLPSGADPYSFYKDGYYYYTHTMGNRLGIWKTKNLANLKTAQAKIIWTPPPGTLYSKEIWAPEIHFIQGKWYMYFAADDGDNNHHRMYVLENASPDPMQGNWDFKGKVADATDKWAIDGDVFEHNGQLYMIWSGWEGDVNVQQNIYIAKMKNPWTIEGPRVMLSGSDFDWEKHGDLPGNPSHVNVNEGPQILKHENKLLIIYSASGCWTDFYALGMLSADKNADLLNAKSWTKSPQPLFKASPENGVYAPGHNSFFKSPDGKEDWILYHANAKPGQGCGNFRSPRMQKFTWNADGTPNFGIPVKEQVVLAVPSGQTRASAKAKLPQNPIFEGWYADPEGVILGNKYWIFPTFSAKYKAQVFLDAFSSKDMMNWKKHPRILDTNAIKWADMAMWAPSIVEKDKQYFLFFSANDIQSAERNKVKDDTMGGIGIAVANQPEGPYRDYLGKPLINHFYNKAQPIDQFVFQDKDKQYYIIYGGWGHCNIGKLNADFTALTPFPNGDLVKEITPEGYVEGPTMFIRNGKYYLMWSEGGWTNGTYKVAYAVSDGVMGPFKKIGTILKADETIATGAGHHSVINIPNTDEWYMVYHRRPIPNFDRDHRVVCIDRLYFNADGTIKDVKMTFEGVKRKLK